MNSIEYCRVQKRRERWRGGEGRVREANKNEATESFPLQNLIILYMVYLQCGVGVVLIRNSRAPSKRLDEVRKKHI